MTRRLFIVAAVLGCVFTPSLAYRQREIIGNTAGEGRRFSGDIFETAYFRPVGFAEEEPYRNADMGPLGVVLSSGEFQITVTDLEIPGRGIPVELSRTYRSKNDGVGSYLGWSWHLSYDETLHDGNYVDPGYTSHPAIQWTTGNGWRQLWVDWTGAGQYTPFSGFYGKLRSLGTGQGYQIRYPDGTVKTFGVSMVGAGGGPVWGLSRIEDRNGNAVTVQFKAGTPGSIKVIDTLTDTLGRKITFSYDGQNRLTTVTDFSGRRVDYGYDAFGNLVWVKAPEVRLTPNGNNFCEPVGAGCPQPRKKTTYAYNGGCAEPAHWHNLTSITDGKGQAFLVNNYYSFTGVAGCGPASGSFSDYVASQVYGGGTVSYSYQNFQAPPDPPADVKVFSTTVTDRNGNVQVHDFNNQGNPLRIEYRTNRGIRTLAGADEPDYVETYTYVDHGAGDRPMLVSNQTESGGFNADPNGNLVSYAGGMTVQYNYDETNADVFQRGNLRSIVKTVGSRGGSALNLTTSYSYEPLFNQPLTLTDPRGHTTSLTYDYQEGTYADLVTNPTASVDPTWWTQGEIMDFLGASVNPGDLNGDGYHRGGNLVVASEGSATGFDGTPSEEIATTFAYNTFGLPTTRRDAELNETHFLYFPENNPDGDGTLTPTPPDGRVLSSVSGAGGGGYLTQEALDASPTMPLPVPPPLQGRESGQNPVPANIPLAFTYDPVGNVKTSTDGRGIRTDYTLNALNQAVQMTHAAFSPEPSAPAFGYLEQFTYDANNNVVQHRAERRDDGSTTPTGRWITKDTTYDVLDRKLTETVTTDDAPAISLTTTYAYDANGNLRKTVFPAGNVVLRQYDERDLLYQEAALKNCTGVTCDTMDPVVDSVTRYDYDGSGNLIQLTDPEGHFARNRYDGFNRKVVGFDPAFQKTLFSYDAGGNLLTQATYGSLGGATPTGPPGSPYPKLSNRKFYYDELGRLRRSDAEFFRYVGLAETHLNGDSNASLTTVAPGDPLPAVGDGWVTSLIRYDRLGRVIGTLDDNGHTSETRYDGLGRKLKVFLSPVAPFIYDPGATPAVDERNAIETVYDADNNPIETLETEWGVDSSGASPRKLPAQQHRTDFKYDAMNLRVETKLVGRVGATPLNYTTTVVYDSRGNRTQVTDPVGGRTKSFFDGLNRLLRTEGGFFTNGVTESIPANMMTPSNPDGKVTTRYTYDDDSRLSSLVDDNNRTTSFLYDNPGRQTRITYPDASYKQLTYNRDSLPATWEHFQGSAGPGRLIVTTQYDALHRAIQKDADSSLAPTFVGTKRQSFEYDGLGRTTRAVEDVDPTDGVVDSEVALAYHSLGRVISEDQTYRDSSSGQLVQGTYTVSSTYNGVGFRTQVSYPGGRMVSFIPDALNRLDSLSDSFTGLTKYDYLGPGRVLNRFSPNATKLTMLSGPGDLLGAGYDSARRVVDFAHKTTAATPVVLSEFTYGYDKASNRLFERRVHEIAGANWKGETYAYDAVYRLTNRSEGSLNAPGVLQGAATLTQDFTLDGLGNWSSHKRNTTTYPNTLNSLNQYTIFQGPQGERDLTYDFAGNLTSEGAGGASYAYDFASRLVISQDAVGNLTTYRYDALGRRISKNLNGQTHTRFVYDGERLIEERDGGDAQVASYVYGSGGGEVLTRRRWMAGSPADLFYQTNALGSVTAVTDSTGAVVERYRYDAYGQPTFLSPSFTPLASSSVFNNLLFTGQYHDVESGLYYFRARAYHPYLGRFLQRDPLGESASLNLYAYVFDNPVNATDPTGMKGLSSSQQQAAMQEGWQALLNMDGGGKSGRGASWDPMNGLRGENRFFGHKDQTSSWHETVAARDKEHWKEWTADHQAKRLEALKVELKASLQDPQNMKNIENPKGVGVNYLGFGQSAAKERSGQKDRSQLDEHANEESLQGEVTFTVSAKNMMVPGTFGEVSQEALKVVADAVKSVTDKLCGNIPVEINGFSRGSGPAVGLTNMLTEDYGLSGSNFTVNLIDPYMSDNWNRINSPDVHVNVFRGTQWDPLSIGVNWGAHLLGVGGRKVYQGSSPSRLPFIPLRVGHTQMDTYFPGVLGTYQFLGY